MTKNFSSIYRIVNCVNNKVYVGSASNTHIRWLKHMNDLKNNKHHSSKLQKAFNKYGENKFIYEVIEKCDVDDLLIKEQHYIDLLDSFSVGYNCARYASNPMKGRHHSSETKQKMSESSKGKSFTKEHRRKLSEAKKGGNISEEHKNKISESLKGRQLTKMTDEIKEKISNTKKGTPIHDTEYKKSLSIKYSGKNNPFYSKKHTEESLEKKRKKILQYDLNGNFIKEWGSLTECSKTLNIRISGISLVLYGKYKHTNNMVFKYKKHE